MSLQIITSGEIYLYLIFLIISILIIYGFINFKISNERLRKFDEFRLTGKYYYKKTSKEYILLVQKRKEDNSLAYFKGLPEEVDLLKKLKFI